MTNRTEAFKSELKALMEKYDVIFDFDTYKSTISFYADSCTRDAVVISADDEAEFMEKVIDCIK